MRVHPEAGDGRIRRARHLGGMKIRRMESVTRGVTHDAEFFPGLSKSWGLTFMVNDENAPNGRPAGSMIGWAALNGFLAFETALYNGLRRA